MPDLILGTAQFGMKYGITNRERRIQEPAFKSLMNAAVNNGILCFDTAQNYGIAEARLGKFFETLPKDTNLNVITKTAFTSPEDTISRLNHSIQLLGPMRVSSVLSHSPSDLTKFNSKMYFDILNSIKNEYKIPNIGASIYSKSEMELALELMPDCGVIQLPANAVDLNLLNSNTVSEFKKNGGKIYVRSVFLQGVLLAPPEQIPPFLNALVPLIQYIDELCKELDISRLECLLGVVKSNPNVDGVIVGITNKKELHQICTAWNDAPLVSSLDLPKISDTTILDPRTWNSYLTPRNNETGTSLK